jgi:hypothetical protein
MARKLGKLPPKMDPRTLLLENYVPARFPKPPARVNHISRVKRWPMYANDRLGDCTCAAAAHMVQSWTAYARRRDVTLPSREVVAAYYAITGGKDDGAVCLDVLNFWRKNGIGGDRIVGFAKLRNADVALAKLSIDLFGSCYLGLALPKFALATRKHWDVPPGGAAGEARPNENNGHCVPAVGYDGEQVFIVTWGRLKAMTWRFYEAYMDEAYAVLNRDWIEKNRKAPSGFRFETLEKDLSRL